MKHYNQLGAAVQLERSDDNNNNNNSSQFRLPDKNDFKILQSQWAGSVQGHKLLQNGVYFTTKQLRQLTQQPQDLHVRRDQPVFFQSDDFASYGASFIHLHLLLSIVFVIISWLVWGPWIYRNVACPHSCRPIR